MEKEKLAILLVGVVFLIAIAQAMQLNSMSQKVGTLLSSAGTALSAAQAGSISSTASSQAASGGGETQEQMMARMHPDQVSQGSGSAGAVNSLPSQVGGC